MGVAVKGHLSYNEIGIHHFIQVARVFLSPLKAQQLHTKCDQSDSVLTLVAARFVYMRGADPNIENYAGLTVLDLAYGYMDQMKINLLEDFGGRHGSSYSEDYMEDFLAYDGDYYYSVTGQG